MFAQLNTTGFQFTETSLPLSLLKADYGDGYAPPAAVVGSVSGVRAWSIRINALPDDDVHAPKIEDQTRAAYLWEFFLARKRESNAAFWLEDPKDGRFYLSEFADDHLSFELLCAKAFATGLQINERRDGAQESPVTVIPGTPPGPPKPDWPEWGETEWGNES